AQAAPVDVLDEEVASERVRDEVAYERQPVRIRRPRGLGRVVDQLPQAGSVDVHEPDRAAAAGRRLRGATRRVLDLEGDRLAVGRPSDGRDPVRNVGDQARTRAVEAFDEELAADPIHGGRPIRREVVPGASYQSVHDAGLDVELEEIECRTRLAGRRE